MDVAPVYLIRGLKLKVKGHDEELTFPIGEETFEEIINCSNAFIDGKKIEWVLFDTLDNWMLLINLEALISLDTWDDAFEPIPKFESQEVYEALSRDLDEQELPEDLLRRCQEKETDYSAIYLYTDEGRKHEIELNKANASHLSNIELVAKGVDDSLWRFLVCESDVTQGFSWFNLSDISLIQIPRIAYQMLTAEEEDENESAA